MDKWHIPHGACRLRGDTVPRALLPRVCFRPPASRPAEDYGEDALPRQPLVTLYALVYLVFGLDWTIDKINDEILMMPVMVSRVLGFSTHLHFLVGLNEITVKAGAALSGRGPCFRGSD